MPRIQAVNNRISEVPISTSKIIPMVYKNFFQAPWFPIIISYNQPIERKQIYIGAKMSISKKLPKNIIKKMAPHVTGFDWKKYITSPISAKINQSPLYTKNIKIGTVNNIRGCHPKYHFHIVGGIF